MRVPRSVDVVTLTKDSEHVLEQCLTSLYVNAPVNQLIVVDGCSRDRTLQIIEAFERKFSNIQLISSRGSRGEARQIGLGKVKTDWFMFVDSDVELCHNWFRKAVKHVDDATGAVWGVDVPANITQPFLRGLAMQIAMRSFRVRGGTHDMLIRREALSDIKIPSGLHVYEDAFIKEWILRKGYAVKALFDPYCLHHRPEEDWRLRGGVRLAAAELKHGLGKYHTMFYVYSACYWLMQNLATSRQRLSKNV